MSRLVIDVTGAQHKQIKALAALHGKTIKDFILEKLFEGKSNDEDAAWSELQTLLNNRIQSAEAGNLSEKSMLDIAKSKTKNLDN
ncbi:hypothetical protein [Tenacibaculum agarivorans]|uniref:hypothetical protein n=1 Tax=Tenacibaculum agarivorans TaxID=1908389 RepID=UPI00094BA43B|nr:hypothetical protein [Tenacibaculum agarivorans]